MAQGEQPAQFSSAIYAAQATCERAKIQTERRPATVGYCSFEANRKS